MRVMGVALVGLVAALPAARADGVATYGDGLTARKFASPRTETEVEVSGYLRVRGTEYVNLDLDRGLTPSGKPLFPVPVADPDGQRLHSGDMRLRTDVAIYAPGTGVAVKMRADILDNLALGSTPEGNPATGRAPGPAASPGQRSPVDAVRIKRAWGEVLTPFGLLAAGRMGAHWGLGMVAHGGECFDCDGGDAADRVAFVSPMAGHMWAVSYDFTASGPVTRRRDQARSIDLEPTDDVRTVTFAVFDVRTDLARARRAAAGRTTFEYGAYVSHRWQDNDVPADYLAVATPAEVSIDPSQVVHRGYRATATDVWLKLTTPRLRVEAEAALAFASVAEPSLIPGVTLGQEVTSTQVGLAVESEYHTPLGAAGLDFGYASGDPAPGFGAFPEPNAPAGQPGDLDGPQADLPRDARVDNFRFHPDYRVDRILFRELIGTVTDAVYLRPHGRVTLLEVGRHGRLDAELAGLVAWAVEPNSTPSGARGLGIEIDPALRYLTRDGFRVDLEYAVLLPGAAFDNPDAGLDARPAQLWRVRLGYFF